MLSTQSVRNIEFFFEMSKQAVIKLPKLKFKVNLLSMDKNRRRVQTNILTIAV